MPLRYMAVDYGGYILLKYIEIDINYSNKSRVIDTYLDTGYNVAELKQT